MAKKKNEDLSIARNVLDLAVGFVTTVEEAGGTIEDARRAIFKDETLKKQIGLLVMGKLKLEGMPCQRLVPHLIPEGWEVVEDVEPTDFDPTKKGIQQATNFGLSDVPALLGADGKGLKTIPAEHRDNDYIALKGTLLRDSGGNLYVPYLHWGIDEWYLNFPQTRHRLG